MAFEWKALIDLAKQLEQQAKTDAAKAETLLRTAVGRAYFGAFGHARHYATAFLWFDPKENADDHGRLRAHLKAKRRHGDATRLDRLRQWRNEADYADDLRWDDVTQIVAAAIQQAEQVFTSLAPPASSAGS